MMKTPNLIFKALSIFFLFAQNSGSLSATTIWSTTTGGNWNLTTTWEGGIVPGMADLVVIRSGAQVSTILGLSNTCSGLTIQSSATLINNGTSPATLTINGPFYNHGTVKNGVAYLTLVIYQDVLFDGAEWSVYKVILQGSATQSITFTNDKIFTGQYFAVEGVPRNIYAESNLGFQGTTIDFNGSALNLPAEGKLSVSGQMISEITLSGQGNRLSMRSGAVIYNSTLVNSLLCDTIRNGSNNLFLEGNTMLDSAALLVNYGSSHTVYVNGNLENMGTISNGSNLLTIYISGNMTQKGTWNNYSTVLSGSSDQYLTFGQGKYYSGQQFYNSNASIKSVYATSDLEFRGTSINFAFGSPGGIRGNLILPENGWLRVDGMTNPILLSRINLASSGTTARLETKNGCYIQGFSNSCACLKLFGDVMVGNNEFYLNNVTENMGTLMNYSVNSHVANISGTLKNLGRIINGQGNLEISTGGDIVHYGLEWSNYKVTLTGQGTRNISQAPYSWFDCSYLETSGMLTLQCGTSLTFNHSKINLYNSSLTFFNPDSLIVRGSDARLVNCMVNGNIVLNMEDGAWLQTVTFNGDVALHGLTPIYNNSVVFNGNVSSDSEIRNQNSTAHTLYLNGYFQNDSLVTNGVSMGNLTLELRANILNSGIWNNYENRFNGTTDQHIRLTSGAPLNSRCLLYANIGGSNFQWFKNSSVIPGATSSVLTLNSITPSDYGVYQCTSSLGNSRIITISNQPAVGFSAIPVTGCTPLPVNFSDTSDTGFPIQQRWWDFGDGASSSELSPVHVYMQPGSYTVSLTINDGYIETQCIKQNIIEAVRNVEVDFSTENVCLGTISFFNDLTTGILYDNQTIIQYASEVTGFSSQYTSGNWSAQQVLGPPDVYPQHDDNILAWASLTANDQREFLTLKFPEPRKATGVIIYETLYPGAVDTVSLRDLSTGSWVAVWSGTATPQPLVARAMELNFPLTGFFTDEVRIAINSPEVAYWNEIDAVALVSPSDTVISNSTVYTWQLGVNGPTFNTKGDLQYTFPEPGVFDVTLIVTNNGLCSDSMIRQVTILPIADGGVVTGSKNITLGMSTGLLTLTDYSGEITNWQRRVNGETWEDIAWNAAVYEETPSSSGVWQYRAQVQSGWCGEDLSQPATIIVHKPSLVTWNGQMDSNWSVAANWTPPCIPDSMIDAVVPNVAPNPSPVVQFNVSCRNLYIQAEGVVTVVNGVTMTVMEDCEIESP